MLAEVSIGPPELSSVLAPAGRLPVRVWALMKKSTSERTSQATTARTSHLRTRRGVIRLRSPGTRSPRRRRKKPPRRVL